MKYKKHLLAALTAAMVFSAGTMTAFAAEVPAAATCSYVCSEGEYCHDGLHGEDCPVSGCENHSEHCSTETAGTCATTRSSRHKTAKAVSHHSAGGHHSSSHHSGHH